MNLINRLTRILGIEIHIGSEKNTTNNKKKDKNKGNFEKGKLSVEHSIINLSCYKKIGKEKMGAWTTLFTISVTNLNPDEPEYKDKKNFLIRQNIP